MTLQWTAVALFLYAEILINIFLCFPCISAQRWRLVFGWRIWSWLSPYWNKFFFAMIMALIVLFVDAVREVQKYSGPEPMQEATVNPNLYDHVHMKLFRAQRNLYICGFSLFLWLIMRRVVTLLTQVAVALETSSGLQIQMEKALKTAEKQQEENQALVEEEKYQSAAQQLVKLDGEKLQDQLKAAEAAVKKSQAEVEAMRSQTKGLAQEYDRLLKEHHQLQKLHCVENKKDE
ncbi:B-cell receptor-associated protein 29 isoform X2 [Nothobranchius furzeri]|uniref:B-cell receptor-associated protein 29 isoform X2 n=1 Tax=Nothobranchius furzeri TaxID=105023 RepID=UPI002403F3DF|nr:B-cell receptor-associated protein 29 isoform X2 [Nothobranchius furzeri]